VGASDGVESIMFAKLLPGNRKIYSFEPSSHNFSRLQHNIKNSVYSDIVLPQQIALGEVN
jgi:FkbM family methyltransferase